MKNSTYNRRSHTVSTVKQVAGDDPGGLPAKEHPPGRGGPPGRWVQPVAVQHDADRGADTWMPSPPSSPLMRWLAPAGILSGEADDQLLHLPGKRWPARLALRVGPGTRDQASVPAQQRLGLHQEAGPA
jgi:hypothetical protein